MSATQSPPNKPPGSPAPVDELMRALLDGDRAQAEAILEEYLEATGSYTRLVDAVVEPAMEKIGCMWAENEITVSDEHLATAIMQTALARTFGSAPAQEPSDHRVLLACVEGNRHALGLQSLADAFDLLGWETRYLGADVPTEALVDHVEKWRPEVVCLSVSLDPHLATADQVVEQVRQSLGDQAPTILLGGPLEGQTDASAATRADAWASSAGEALEAVA